MGDRLTTKAIQLIEMSNNILAHNPKMRDVKIVSSYDIIELFNAMSEYTYATESECRNPYIATDMIGFVDNRIVIHKEGVGTDELSVYTIKPRLEQGGK